MLRAVCLVALLTASSVLAQLRGTAEQPVTLPSAVGDTTRSIDTSSLASNVQLFQNLFRSISTNQFGIANSQAALDQSLLAGFINIILGAAITTGAQTSIEQSTLQQRCDSCQSVVQTLHNSAVLGTLDSRDLPPVTADSVVTVASNLTGVDSSSALPAASSAASTVASAASSVPGLGSVVSAAESALGVTSATVNSAAAAASSVSSSTLANLNLNTVGLLASSLGLSNLLSSACRTVASPQECAGLVSVYGPVLLNVLRKRLLAADRTCAQWGFCSAPANSTTRAAQVDQFIASTMGQFNQSAGVTQAAFCGAAAPQTTFGGLGNTNTPFNTQPNRNSTTGSSNQTTGGNKTATALHVLHFSDVHLDSFYQANSNADCPDLVCCHGGSGSSGKYGTSKCDSPAALVSSAVDAAAANAGKIDFIIFTGNVPSHDIFNLSQAESIRVQGQWYDTLQQKFPNVTVYPAVGQYDLYPVFQYDPVDANGSVVALADLYQQKKVLSADALTTFRQYGYYSVVHPGTQLRIISINTAYCDALNLYNFQRENSDPGNQLQWLVNTLAQAKSASQKVVIIGSIPLGSDTCASDYGRRYEAAIAAYHDIIAGQFFGSLQYDTFEIGHYPQRADVKTGVLFVGPGISPYAGSNPAFRVYSHDASSFQVTDWQQWYLDLTSSNASWALQYAAKATYSLNNFTVCDFENLSTQLQSSSNSQIFQTYFSNYVTKAANASQCNAACRQRRICEVQFMEAAEYRQCIGLTNPLAQSDKGTPTEFLGWIADTYY